VEEVKVDAKEAGDADAAWALGPRRHPMSIRMQRKQKNKQIHKRKEILMPGGDQTGPMGQGPMTGRAAGFCAGYNQAGWAHPMRGRGFGRGRGGGGRGHRHWFYATGLTGWQRAAMPQQPGTPLPNPLTGSVQPGMTAEQELAVLKQQADRLEAGLEQVRNRIQDLSKVEAK